MNIILDNPYRISGLLVGATAAEQRRQITRLQKFIEAEKEPDADFSFEILGNLNRTLESVNESSSKLNLDSDKMNAALFWFYNGNSIVDGPAFEELKYGNIDKAIEYWRKLIYDSQNETYNEITKRNASAFHNLSIIYLQKYGIHEDTIRLKLHFLESDFFNELKIKATDETYKISKKDIQLLFLNSLIQYEHIDISEFIDTISKIDFLCKEDFLKSFIQKPIENIERKIDEAKNNREKDESNAIKFGNELFKQTKENLLQIKSVVGDSNLKYSSIADKVANEILQCSIDYFNHFQEKDSNVNYLEKACKLAELAKKVAVGKFTKDRIRKNLTTIEEMKDMEMSQAIETLKNIQLAYELNKAEIMKKVNAMPLGYNQTINWSNVNKRIEDSLDWDKVTNSILRDIPIKNIDKIKNENNQLRKNEYKNLVNFVFTKLNYTQKNKVRYICYWDTPGLNIPTTGDLEKMPDWLKWVCGIVIFIILIKACN